MVESGVNGYACKYKDFSLFRQVFHLISYDYKYIAPSPSKLFTQSKNDAGKDFTLSVLWLQAAYLFSIITLTLLEVAKLCFAAGSMHY